MKLARSGAMRATHRLHITQKVNFEGRTKRNVSLF